MEHAIHLGAGHFIRVVSPTSTRVLIKKFKKVSHNAGLDDESINLDALEADPEDDDDDNDNDNDGDDNDDNDNDDNGDGDGNKAASEAAGFSVGDTIGKSLALVKQVSGFIYVNGCVLIYSGLKNRCNVWGFWIVCDVALNGVGISLSIGRVG